MNIQVEIDRPSSAAQREMTSIHIKMKNYCENYPDQKVSIN